MDQYVTALYDYKGTGPNSLSFNKGDVITVFSITEQGWGDGMLNGQRGWFPSNYVTKPQSQRPRTEKPAIETKEIPNWGKKVTANGKTYWYNFVTNETAWSLEEVDPVTGKLLRKREVPRQQQAIPAEVGFGSRDPTSWDFHASAIIGAIEELALAIASEQKEAYINLTANVVEAVRTMLYASGTAQRDSQVLLIHQTLKESHKKLLSSLSKVVVAAKAASAVWPAPDEIHNLQKATGNLLLAIRLFISQAKELGLKIDPLLENKPMEQSGPGSNIIMLGNMQSTIDTVADIASQLKTEIEDNNCDMEGLINRVTVIVTHIGNVIAVADEFHVDSFSPKVANVFKSNRLSLYNCVSGLVMATQTATADMAPSDGLDQVLLSLDLLVKAARDLLVATKFLVEEVDSTDQAHLKEHTAKLENDQYIKRSNTLNSLDTRQIQEEKDREPRSKSANTSATNITFETEKALHVERRVSDIRTSFVSQASDTRTNSLAGSSDLGSAIDPRGRNNSGFRNKFGEISAPTPWFLKEDLDPSEIILSPDGSIKGATIEALIEKLTTHETPHPQFIKTFLITYSTFIDSLELFDCLCERFLLNPPEDLSEADLRLWVDKKQNPIRLRVFHVLKAWVEKYIDLSRDRDLLGHMREFVQDTMSIETPTLASQLLRILERPNVRASRSMLPAGNIPHPNLPRGFSLKKNKITDIEPLEFARQLTLFEAQVYSRISHFELLAKAWSQKNKCIAENVQLMIKRSNQITGFIASIILREPDLKKRASLVKYFISVAEKCRSLNNYNSLMAIMASLDSAPVHRLARTWTMVPSKTIEELESLRETMNPIKNFAKYRETLRSVKPPAVPFLGFYLTDLTFIEDGNPDIIKDSELINFSKRTKIAAVIREISQFQEVPYALTAVPEIQEYLTASLDGYSEDQDLYEVSLIVEPKEREDEKITRLLHESGFL